MSASLGGHSMFDVCYSPLASTMAGMSFFFVSVRHLVDGGSRTDDAFSVGFETGPSQGTFTLARSWMHGNKSDQGVAIGSG